MESPAKISIPFQISEFGNPGEFVKGTFNGSYQDSLNVQHTLSGSFQAVRN